MASRSSNPMARPLMAAIALTGVLGSGFGIRAQEPTPQPPVPPQTARPEPSERVAERIKVLQHEADLLATQERGLLTELRKFEVQRQLKTAELRQIEGER